MTSKINMLAAFGAVIIGGGAMAAPPPDAALPRVRAIVDQDYPRVEAIYKDIHQHPELAFQEVRTAALLAKQMRALGFTVTEKVGRTGVVAMLRNGPGPTVLVRTELDALPMAEKTGLPYASKVVDAPWEGKKTAVAHSCGHDVHMAAWLATAKVLVDLKGEWRGTLMFVAQPAEELVSGAKAMVDDGLFTRFARPDYAFALHTSPAPAGRISLKPGAATSAGAAVDVLFIGRGGHGSMPSSTIDPIVIGAHFVTDVQTVVSREKNPGTFGVISVGAFQAGTAGNIIPDQAQLRLTVRSFDAKVQTALIDGVRRTAAAAAMMASAPPPKIDVPLQIGPMMNDVALTARASSVLSAAFGDAFTAVPLSGQPSSASEDFSVFPEQGIPSVFFSVGANDPALVAAAARGGPPAPVNHSPYFAPVPRPTITAAATAMSIVVMASMKIS